ncbi:SlyX family protein [Abyssibius alkaniclasticus]|uniref:SlyX family protein n=1 Tax=Abyssibius alkaniclasticus TaxID=2881234 RepID=UPI004059BA0D
MENRLTQLEETIAHQQSVIDDLNTVVTDQAARLAVLERRVQMLLQAAAQAEADGQLAAPPADQRPPHY